MRFAVYSKLGLKSVIKKEKNVTHKGGKGGSEKCQKVSRNI